MHHHIAYIALGSNLGDRRAYLRAAVEQLAATPGIDVAAQSATIETAPVGGPTHQGHYLNAVVALRATLDPHALLAHLGRIEADLGRQRTEHCGPRTIDLDLLLYDDRIIDTPDLTVPHARMHQRRFVLVPLAEIAPDAYHPVLQKTIRHLLEELPDDDTATGSHD